MNLSEIKTNPNNPRLIKDARFKQLKKSIEDLPHMMVLRPIVVDETGTVLGGNMRLEALKSLGYKEVPDDWVKRTDELSEEQKREFVIKDNSGFGEWDWDQLANEWNEYPLADWGVDVPEDWAASPVVEEDESAVAEMIDKAAELQEKWKVERGQIWGIGRHRLMCGDSTDAKDVAALMGDVVAEMMFTDPPYGVGYSGGVQFDEQGNATTDNRQTLENDESSQIYNDFLPVVISYVDGPCYMWFAGREGLDPFNALYESNCQIHALLIWNKINATYGALNAQYKQRHEPCLYFKPKGSTLRWCGPTDECTVWDVKRDGVNEWHPTQKPVELAFRAIGNHDAQTIVDWFAGSGSTIAASEQRGRQCFAMEMEPKYCAVTLERLSALGLTPRLAETKQ